MKFRIYIAASVDGYVAGADGSVAWLDEFQAQSYGHFIQGIDAIVIGRTTFEQVLAFGRWPCAGKQVFVLTSRPLPSPETAPWAPLGQEPISSRRVYRDRQGAIEPAARVRAVAIGLVARLPAPAQRHGELGDQELLASVLIDDRDRLHDQKWSVPGNLDGDVAHVFLAVWLAVWYRRQAYRWQEYRWFCPGGALLENP